MTVVELKPKQVRSRRERHDATEFLPSPGSLAAPSRTFKCDVRYLARTVSTSLPLAVTDVLCFAGALFAAYFIAGLIAPEFAVNLPAFGVTVGVAMFVVYAAFGLYPGVGLSAVAELRITSLATTSLIAVLVAAALGFDAGASTGKEIVLVLAWPVLIVAVPLLRRLMRKLVAGQSWWGYPVIIFGGGSDGAKVYHRLMQYRTEGLKPLGIIDDLHLHWRDRYIEPAWYLGPLEATPQIARERGAFWGVIAMTNRPVDDIRRCADQCARTIHHLIMLPDASQLPGARACESMHTCGGVPSMRLDDWFLSPVPRFVKRTMDLAIAGTLTILILPLLLLIAAGVWVSSPGNVLYSQIRIGKGGRPFRIWKFRSMVMHADRRLAEYLENNPEMRAEWRRKQKLKNDPRITAFGKLLRKTSLDELPQLWNVLNGDMSLVGPRPILESQMEQFAEALPFYTRVRPGITGIWQISGRNKTTFDERVHLDAEYARIWSPWLDMYILVRTLAVVVRCEGAC